MQIFILVPPVAAVVAAAVVVVAVVVVDAESKFVSIMMTHIKRKKMTQTDSNASVTLVFVK